MFSSLHRQTPSRLLCSFLRTPNFSLVHLSLALAAGPLLFELQLSEVNLQVALRLTVPALRPWATAEVSPQCGGSEQTVNSTPRSLSWCPMAPGKEHSPGYLPCGAGGD